MECEKLLNFIKESRNYSIQEMADLIGCDIKSIRRWMNAECKPTGYFYEKILVLYYSILENTTDSDNKA